LVPHAAAAAGITRVQVVEADGDTLIAVQRKGLTADQKLALAIADNRTADLAEWDIPVLEDLTADHPDILGDWFTAADMAELTAGPDDDDADEDEDQDEDDDPGDPNGQPLAIVLSSQEFRLWRQVKDQLGYSTDKATLLKLAGDCLQRKPQG
jgi:hypothetical protein